MIVLLEGYTVLELAGHAGQMTGRMLRELGARVIKVEALQGDPVRWTLPPRAGDPVGSSSLTYRHLNAGKLAIALDYKGGSGRRVLKELVSGVDVLVTTCPRLELATLGLSGPEFRDLNRGIVHVSLTPFGLSGPKSEWRATDEVAFASGGLLSIAGSPGGRPCLPPETQAYYFGSYVAVLAAVAGLHSQRSKPVIVDVSLQEALASQEHLLPAWLNRGEVIRRSGSQHRSVAPAAVFPTRDGFVYLFVSRIHWKSFLDAWPDHPVMFDDARWLPNEYRRCRADEVTAAVSGFTSRYSTETFVRKMQDAGVPCLAVNSPTAYLQHDLARRRQIMQCVPLASGEETLPIHAAPFRVDGERTVPGPVSPIGGDTEYVLTQVLHWTSAAVKELRTEGVVGDELVLHEKERSPACLEGSQMTDGKIGNDPFRMAGVAVERPLVGVRVISMTTGIAGPLTARYLALLGADVIKFESRHGGIDSFRFFGDTDADINASPRFIEMNTNVRSVALNLKNPQGQRLALELATTSDVLVDNFRPDVLERLGLGRDRLQAARPEMVILKMPGFEIDGEFSRFPTWGPTLSAFAGLTALWNHPDTEIPVGFQGSYPDYIAGVLGPALVIAALLKRRRTGRGSFIELSQCEAVSFSLGAVMADAASGGEPSARGNRCDVHRPCGVYPCRGDDRWCVISVGSDSEWEALRAILGLELNGADRRGDLDESIESVTRTWDSETLASTLQDAGIAASPVATGKDLATDAQLSERRFVEVVQHSSLGKFHLPRMPIKFPPGFVEPARQAPSLGEASHSVICGLLGHSEEEYARWVEEGVIG